MAKPINKNAELETLGKYFDEHIDDEAEWGEALPSPTNVLATARRHLATGVVIST